VSADLAIGNPPPCEPNTLCEAVILFDWPRTGLGRVHFVGALRMLLRRQTQFLCRHAITYFSCTDKAALRLIAAA
jgi:hypothetical protein